MIESKIETIFVKRLKCRLEKLNIQVVGTWDVGSLTENKGEEDAGATGVLVVKIQPRQYATPTVPNMTLNGALSLSVRGEIDFDGKIYLEAVKQILDEMEMLQKCYHDTHMEYSLPDEGFEVVGFQLGQGDNNINPTSKIYSYTHQFSVMGVITNP